MISILIPIHNYNATPLVQELQLQCLNSGIDFEIICIDDCSSICKEENNTISEINHCHLYFLDKNIGRSKIRNLLAYKATFDWLLFLDCDTFPKSEQFIRSYLKQITQPSCRAIFGGLDYDKLKPKDNQLLRWVYGQNREAKTALQRLEHPYTTSYVSNFLIQRSLFRTIQFDESIITYGYEDAIFIQSLKTKNIIIDQIENPVFHLNLETSEMFLSKTKEALKTLLYLSHTNKHLNSKLIRTYRTLHTMKLDSIMSKIFTSTKSILEKNLTSKKPSLILFDLYKISYFCYLNKK
jgi:glycosyltransferase involved in cell wall biosynthesis